MSNWNSARHRTAIVGPHCRCRPGRRCIDGVLERDQEVLDYGAGRGLDVQRLRSIGFDARGWDSASPRDPGLPRRTLSCFFTS